MYIKNNRSNRDCVTGAGCLTLAGLTCAAAVAAASAHAAPAVPDTNDSTWRYQQPPQPGWTDINGSCDTSSVTTYGLEASAGAFGDPALAGYVDLPSAVPIAGHSHFASCGTWRDGEGAQATISDLIIGEIYTVDFFVGGFRPIAESPSRTYEVGDTYQISVGTQSSGNVTFDSTDWVAQSFTFTANNTAETIAVIVASAERRSVTHFAMAANAVTVADQDQDGLSDSQEIAAGTNVLNPDSDGDGLSDAAELNTYNTNPIEADTDGGGVDDGTEVANATDPLANNRDDFPAVDTDADGLTDDTEVALGTDPASADSDKDGLNDGDEVNTYQTDPLLADTDNDGLADNEELNLYQTNPLLADTDGDSLLDGSEIASHGTDPLQADTDNDSLSDGAEISTFTTNPLEPDSDGDGLADGNEINNLNTDPNDTDTDNDGLSDTDEVNTWLTDPLNSDTDNSGVTDGEEISSGSDPLVGTDDVINLDTDNDGIPNSIEGNADQDADGIPNFEDLDSDNDGIADIIEAGGSDTDNNGIIDNFSDANNDGLDDAIAAMPLIDADVDLDGLPNFLDSDSDNDGLSDLFEAGGIDAQANGMVDDLTDANRDGWADVMATNPLPLTDTDVDGTPNYLDIDSDADGIFDLIEAGGEDTDLNGVIDLFLDSDADGITDLADIDSTGGEDTDNDGVDDQYDASITLAADINQNGIDDHIEADSDGNGWATRVLANATLPDENGNGIPEVYEYSGGGPGLITGLSGGAGCTIDNRTRLRFDPLLIIFALGSLGLLRRRASSKRIAADYRKTS